MAKHRPYPESSLMLYSKEAEDRLHHEQQVWREEEMLLLQQEQTEWLKERERQNQIQKELKWYIAKSSDCNIVYNMKYDL